MTTTLYTAAEIDAMFAAVYKRLDNEVSNPPVSAPSLDFSLASNSMYIPLIER